MYNKHMQFRVPQNITMEDRIVGPLSPIQFGIVLIGGGIAFFIFQSGLPSPIPSVFGGLFALFTAILAVGKYNDQPMYRFIKFIYLFATRPRVRIWHKETGEFTLIKPSRQRIEEKHHAVKNISKEDIARLAVVLDSRGAIGIPPVLNPNPEEKS